MADPYPTTARPCDHCRRCPHRAPAARPNGTSGTTWRSSPAPPDRVVEQLWTTASPRWPSSPTPRPIHLRASTPAVSGRCNARLGSRSRPDPGPTATRCCRPTSIPAAASRFLPPPDTGDLFFDLEGDPYRGNGGLEYLWGISDVHDTTDRGGATHRRTNAPRSRRSWTLLTEHLTSHPNAHVSTTHSYEIDVVRRLALRHASREDQLQRMFTSGDWSTCTAIVRQTIVTSRPGYGMKQLEHFYRPGGRPRCRTAGQCRRLRGLAGRWRPGAARRHPGVQPRRLHLHPTAPGLDRSASASRSVQAIRTISQLPPFSPTSHPAWSLPGSDRAEIRLAQRLRDGLPDALDQRDETERRNDLLLQLLEWHRREARRRASARTAAGRPDAEIGARAEASWSPPSKRSWRAGRRGGHSMRSCAAYPSITTRSAPAAPG